VPAVPLGRGRTRAAGAHGAHGLALPERVLPIPTWSADAVGLDLLLASFALGAAQVAVLAAGSHDPAPLAAQVRIGEAILAGLGYGEGHFRILTDDDPEALAANLRGWPSAAAVPVAADFRLLDTKRDTLELAIAHLRRHAPLAVHEIALPAGAPFGSVTASDACTLCMGCVGSCPSGALVAAAMRRACRSSNTTACSAACA